MHFFRTGKNTFQPSRNSRLLTPAPQQTQTVLYVGAKHELGTLRIMEVFLRYRSIGTSLGKRGHEA